MGRQQNRLSNVDILRGIVMVVMALDHTRDFVMLRSFQPTDLDQTTPALFFTRWITHFCAPVFVFLAGTSAYLHGQRGLTRNQLAVFLFTRGLWLIFLEFTVIRFYLTLSIDPYFPYLGLVFWALGCSMIVLSILVYLPLPLIVAFGVVLIVGHNALDKISAYDVGPFGGIWAVLHTRTPIPVVNDIVFVPAYPLVPWIGVMAVGYGFGAVLQLPRQQRRLLTAALGFCIVGAFELLRTYNIYGDPLPWDIQYNVPMTICAFLNCLKYPPSLLYLLMTLGPALIFLAAIDREPGWLGRRFIVFGRVPLFYYLLHLPLILCFAFLCAWLQRGPEVFSWKSVQDVPNDLGSLPLVYGVWVAVIVLLYPVCAWYATVKQRHRDWQLLSYL